MSSDKAGVLASSDECLPDGGNEVTSCENVAIIAWNSWRGEGRGRSSEVMLYM